MARFIAEISSNHNGDLDRCQELIRQAAACGCWGVKFQLFRVERLFAPIVLQSSAQHRLRRRWELPRYYLPELAACARDAGLAFGCTPFDLEAVQTLRPHVDFLKIASYELPWLELVRACAATGLPLQISRGMARAAEIASAARTAAQAGATDLTLLHCVSRYPAPATECNLAALGGLRDLLAAEGVAARVGWSDHSVDAGVVSRAVRHWGAEVVEFHFDLEGRGVEYAGRHCWLPRDIQPVIAGQSFPAPAGCDGSGDLEPVAAEAEERPWRADPSDGLRPTLAVRRQWQERLERESAADPLVVLVAGGPGLGHLARLLALAEALREEQSDCRREGQPDAQHQESSPERRLRFLFFPPAQDKAQAQGSQAVLARDMLARHGFAWSDDPPTAENLLAGGPAACVVDFKEPCASLIEALQKAGCPTVVLDRPDCAQADRVIVPCFAWSPARELPHVVGGPEYLLVRQDMARLRPAVPPPVGRRVVVSFGAEDPFLLTEKVGAALARLPEQVPVDFILGPGLAQHRPVWPPPQLDRENFRLITTSDSLESLLPGAGLLITALGVTVAEAQQLGVPVAVLTNYEADAQQMAAMARAGAVADLGYHRAVTEDDLAHSLAALWADGERRRQLAGAGHGHADGQGAARCAAVVRALLDEGAGGESC